MLRLLSAFEALSAETDLQNEKTGVFFVARATVDEKLLSTADPLLSSTVVLVITYFFIGGL